MSKAPKKVKKPGIGHNRGPRVRDARIGPLYKTYRFTDYDPVIAVLRHSKDEAKVKNSVIRKDSGVSSSTLYNWDRGKTRKPQFATVVAVARAIGAIDAIRDLITKGR